MSKITHHLKHANAAIDAVHAEVKKGHTLTPAETTVLLDLTKLVVVVRDQMIRCDLAAGLSGKEAALKYGLTAGRVSQIKRESAAAV